MLNTRLFEAKEYSLQIYNGQALIDRAFRFFTVVDCESVAYEEIDFDFPGYDSSYFRVFNERNGSEILEIALERSGSYLIANANAETMTFEDNGNYYYEIGYVRSGYEQALRYGMLNVL
jgi:hypothetical protein